MQKFKVGQGVRIKDTDWLDIVDGYIGDTYSHPYTLQGKDDAAYSEDELEAIKDDSQGGSYVVATDEGHGNWSISDSLKSEEEVLERIASGLGSKYRVFKEVNVSLKLEEK